jgi:hypothetical protein
LFYRHKHKYGGIIVKWRNSESVNTAFAPRKTKKAHPTYTSSTCTTKAMLQVHQGTNQAKEEANRLAQGVATPPPSPLGLSLLWWFHGGMQ